MRMFTLFIRQSVKLSKKKKSFYRQKKLFDLIFYCHEYQSIHSVVYPGSTKLSLNIVNASIWILGSIPETMVVIYWDSRQQLMC